VNSEMKKMVYCQDAKTRLKIIGKYIMLKMQNSRNFFRIVNILEKGKDGIFSRPRDSHEWDSRICAELKDGRYNIPVFDFRKDTQSKNIHGRSTQFVLMEVEGYGLIFTIGVLFNDAIEVVGIAE
jgi:hypothetical protein